MLKAFIKMKSSTVLIPRDTIHFTRRMVKRYFHSIPYMKCSHRVFRVQASTNSKKVAAKIRTGVTLERYRIRPKAKPRIA